MHVQELKINGDIRYHAYGIPKENGTMRMIHVPMPELKKQQVALLRIMETTFASYLSPGRVQGGVRGRSCKSHAQIHRGAKFLLTMDIKDFYNNVKPAHILKTIDHLVRQGIVNDGRDLFGGLDYDVVMNILFMKHPYYQECLPTGAPTSPIAANIACYLMDSEIEKVLNNNYKYSRYFDDIAISTYNHKRDWNLIRTISKTISASGFTVNPHKTKWMTRGCDNMLITGIATSNQGILSVPRKMYRSMRVALYHLAKEHKDIPENIKGMLSYISSINKQQEQKLSEHYEKIRKG